MPRSTTTVSRFFGMFLIVLAAAIGWIAVRDQYSQSPLQASKLETAAQAAPSIPIGPIAEFDLAGTRRAKPCPTMGALEVLGAQGSGSRPNDSGCKEIPARRSTS